MKQLAFLCSLVLCGCAVGPDFHTPAAPDTQTYTHNAEPSRTVSAGGADGSSQTFTTADTPLPMWWTPVSAPAELDRLVEQALQSTARHWRKPARSSIEARENYNAQVGRDTISERRRDDFRNASTGRSRGVRHSACREPRAVLAIQRVGERILYIRCFRRQSPGARSHVGASRLRGVRTRRGAACRIAGNVVSTAVQRASLQQQIVLTQRLADAQAQQLAIMEGTLYRRWCVAARRAQPAHAARADARVAAAARYATRAGGSPACDPARRRAVQSGFRRSSRWTRCICPTEMPVTLPSTLARQRPDIRASEALLHQASANVGVATANLYPQFSLSAGIGSERTSIQDIVNGLNIWNIGLNLTQPIFHGGELRAKKRAAEAAYDAALASYQQTVLQALQQVADALTALHNDAHELHARDDAAQRARANLEIARAQYSAGGVSQFSLLDTQRQALQTALDQTHAQAARLSDTAALFQSLGSGEADLTLGSAP